MANDMLPIDSKINCIYYIDVNYIHFIWDEVKSKRNKRIHGVSFEEARSVFFDENARLVHDPDHSVQEDRFIILGVSLKLRLLLVCHCYRESEEQIRIISARKANSKEIDQYRRQ